MRKYSDNDGLRLYDAALSSAPENELGVVFLFAKLQERYGVRVEKIQAGFPDCIARRIRGKDTGPIRIEFEYKSANFRVHGHDPNGCDWIVCWEHNWPDVPRHLRVVELRRRFGLGWHVWLNPKDVRWEPGYAKAVRNTDSIPRQAQNDDLLLIYFRKPLSQIRYIYRIEEIRRDDNGRIVDHSGKEDWWATTTRVCELKTPLSLDVMKRHKELANAWFIRGSLQGRWDITVFWPEIYQLMIERNRHAGKVLSKYAPEKIDGELISMASNISGVVQEPS
ncbi:MAG TPA: hypothetical protein PKM59_14980 [Thermodesulfobacteriota bacterium]|nr:hypothetical protein [Thermodesulfobacteriota bacterium]HNU72727.1 hypothetical protein [Thermodesulfobacteriota bacterium]